MTVADGRRRAESEANGEAIDLRVTAGNPTDEELAAVTAVISSVVQAQAAEDAPLTVPDGQHWQRANGILRGPLRPGPGAWRSF